MTTTTVSPQMRSRVAPPKDVLSTEFKVFDFARNLVKLSAIDDTTSIDIDSSRKENESLPFGGIVLRAHRQTPMQSDSFAVSTALRCAAAQTWLDSTEPELASLRGVPISDHVRIPPLTEHAWKNALDAWHSAPASGPLLSEHALRQISPTAHAFKAWAEPWQPRPSHSTLGEPSEGAGVTRAQLASLGGMLMIGVATDAAEVRAISTARGRAESAGKALSALLSSAFDAVKLLEELKLERIWLDSDSLSNRPPGALDAFEPGEFGDVEELSAAFDIDYISADPGEFSHWWSSKGVGNHFATKIAHRLDELEELDLDEDAVLPTPKVVNAAKKVAGYLPSDTTMPEIEVDDSVGSISFVWSDENAENSFSLNFPNGDLVVAIGAGSEGRRIRSWKCSVEDQRRILANIQSSKDVTSFLSGK